MKAYHFKTFLFILLLFGFFKGFSQNLTGTIYEIDNAKKKAPLTGVNMYWVGTQIYATTDVTGKFKIKKPDTKKLQLVISFVGYKTDTLTVMKSEKDLEIVLSVNKELKEVVIQASQDGSYISKMKTIKTEVITTAGLQKAACCNLSESFETNASVDVSYSDAITGAKQIQLLGLSGIYSQIQTENIPSIRGMASTFGLNYIPGSWMESIQISKGTSSVINGYESITGQINVEYKKPTTSERLLVNVYGNQNQRLEANVTSAFKLNKKLSTMLMIHAEDFSEKINNIDSTTINLNGEKVNLGENFMDLPLVTSYNIFNRWEYSTKRWESRFGIKYMNEDRRGGTMDYNKNTFVLDTSKINSKSLPYGFGLKTNRAEAFWKNGFMFPDKPYKSVGLILSGVYHDQKGFFGVNDYYGKEQSLYANLIYQSIIGNTNHKFSTGLSYLYDNYEEGYDQTQFRYLYQVNSYPVGASAPMYDITTLYDYRHVKYNWDRMESVPGAFFEYTYNYLTTFTLIAGIRADYHNKYGLFYTPRTNMRWQINEGLTVRASAGLGYRTANIISENLSLLASQRILLVEEPLKQEKAANYGINITKDFRLFKNKAQFTLDFYRTDFMNQVIVDLDRDPTTAYFYNLRGKSYSNSYQAQLTIEPLKHLTILMAYRINDAKTTIDSVLQERLLQNKYKGLLNISYATNFEKWKFDFTSQFNGSARISPQEKMPEIVRRDYERTPEYIILNAQITKKFRHDIDVYVGVENLTNFKQKDPITEAFIPYHTHFDTTMAWGPIIGRVIYAGMRFSIK
ncbi:MAG: TonB-dependent receptor [Bacteroidetes bacterium]|nr:TonB-dependent receptor [Bacteroidota bacterium]